MFLVSLNLGIIWNDRTVRSPRIDRSPIGQGARIPRDQGPHVPGQEASRHTGGHTRGGVQEPSERHIPVQRIGHHNVIHIAAVPRRITRDHPPGIAVVFLDQHVGDASRTRLVVGIRIAAGVGHIGFDMFERRDRSVTIVICDVSVVAVTSPQPVELDHRDIVGTDFVIHPPAQVRFGRCKVDDELLVPALAPTGAWHHTFVSKSHAPNIRAADG